jgi:hypothetical protein
VDGENMQVIWVGTESQYFRKIRKNDLTGIADLPVGQAGDGKNGTWITSPWQHIS